MVKKDGTVIDVNIGEDENDPVVGISDLLVHLSADQLKKEASKVIEGEDLDVTVASMPLKDSEKDTVKANAVSYTHLSPLDEMIDMYVKECLEKMGFPSYFLAERLNVDEKIKVVRYLQEKGTFKVKGAIVLVAEKLAVSEPTVYRYLKKMEK